MYEGLKILLGATVADAALRDRNIPLAWIKKTTHAKKILEYI